MWHSELDAAGGACGIQKRNTHNFQAIRIARRGASTLGTGAIGAHRHLDAARARLSGHEQGHQADAAPLQRRRRRTADQADVPVADGRGGVRAAHRLRECREPAARALDAAHARNRGARLARRQPLAHRPSTARGEPAAVDPQRRARDGVRNRRHPRVRRGAVRQRQAVLDDIQRRRRRHRLSRRRVHRDGRRVRACAGAARVEDRRQRRDKGRRRTQRHRRRARAALDGGADRQRDRPHARAACRRRLHDAQLSHALWPESRLRDVASADAEADAAADEVPAEGSAHAGVPAPRRAHARRRRHPVGRDHLEPADAGRIHPPDDDRRQAGAARAPDAGGHRPRRRRRLFRHAEAAHRPRPGVRRSRTARPGTRA